MEVPDPRPAGRVSAYRRITFLASGKQSFFIAPSGHSVMPLLMQLGKAYTYFTQIYTENYYPTIARVTTQDTLAKFEVRLTNDEVENTIPFGHWYFRAFVNWVREAGHSTAKSFWSFDPGPNCRR